MTRLTATNGPTLSRKASQELAFWTSRVKQEGVLRNDHYAYFYTLHFGWEQAFYQGKRLLDIGCGPRGSLEWAAEASLRVGLDPLAEAYWPLGIGRHMMQYVTANAEQMPFADGAFDVVCSLNSLDHVDDLNAALAEIRRVVRTQGYFLLISDIHRQPTILEPSAYSWDVVEKFLPAFEIVEQQHYEHASPTPEGFGDIYRSIRKGLPYNHADATERYGILSVKFKKRAGQ
jgi:ubiquinone/menaquinone biosynthesis C-methylase UbiE